MATPCEELSGYMPPARIVEALDDDGDGIADEKAWEAVSRTAEDRLRAVFGAATVPATFETAHARRLFELSLLYARRGLGGDENPFEAAAEAAEARLRALASGDESADGAGTDPVIIGERAKFAGAGGLLA